MVGVLNIEKKILTLITLGLTISLLSSLSKGQTIPHPDRFYTIRGADSLLFEAIAVDGITSSADDQEIQLQNDRLKGYIILKERRPPTLFNRGLPSWNGSASTDSTAFRLFMRFLQGSDWSPWLTVGYWKDNLWHNYGTTSYSRGQVDIDYVKLYDYASGWQYKVELKRDRLNLPSPAIHKLCFFTSDSRTTTEADYEHILNDNPEPIVISTQFLYQYDLDTNIGGNICSPTSVSMVLQSYNIPVDPITFALETYDPVFHIFGVWPRAVQNASEYGLDGAVTRYRTWSDTREVLAQGGRIVLSIGPPLYTGHLLMLAGFDAGGNPIVHDPAQRNGYSYVYAKSDLSHAWFDKGGIGYTLFQKEPFMSVTNREPDLPSPNRLMENFPNPFNPFTTLRFDLPRESHVTLTIYDILGREIITLINQTVAPGTHSINWDTTDDSGQPVTSGMYLYQIRAGTYIETRKMMLLR